jgi:uncharacterized protein (DUF58 family)
MKLFPTRITFHVAAAGAFMVVLGAVWKVPPLVAFGAATVLAVSIGRRLAHESVAHLREAGFEMVWKNRGRITRMVQGETRELILELRNRGADDLRGLDVRVLASPSVQATIEPRTLDLPGGETKLLTVRLQTSRVGRFGLHGLALDVRGIPVGGDSLYEAPLMFANPHGVEVLPLSRSGRLLESSTHARLDRSSGKGRRRGEGDDFRELRDHTAQDAFNNIAWKASARRGKWLVRETERASDVRTVVLLETSGAIMQGAPGFAPFDVLLPRAYATLLAAQRRGDQVGLVTFCLQLNAVLEPKKRKRALEAELVREALLSSSSFHDAHRNETLEHELAEQVREHLRPLDPDGLRTMDARSLDALADRADRLKHRAPFQSKPPGGPSLREQRLRHYARVFGLDLPARVADVSVGMALAIDRAEASKASVVEVFASAPKQGTIFEALRRLRKSGTRVNWNLAPEATGPRAADTLLAGEAARTRAELVTDLSRRELVACGVRVTILRSGEPFDAATELTGDHASREAIAL